MVMFIFMCASAALAAAAAWYLLYWVQREYARYRKTFQRQAARGLADFFLFVDPVQLWAANLLLAGMPAALILVLGGHLALAAVAAGMILAVPRFLLSWARRQRRRRLDAQLPDFLLALAGALRAGSGLQSGLVQVVSHLDKPLAQELSLLLQEQRMGVAFNDALDAFQGRIGTESVNLFVAAVKVAGQTGGSLAETLESISSTLRMRLQLMAKIRALTSQGRLQAWIMAALPLLLALALHALDPSSMAQLWETPMGWGIIAMIVLLEFMGLYIVRRIVDIEV